MHLHHGMHDRGRQGRLLLLARDRYQPSAAPAALLTAQALRCPRNPLAVAKSLAQLWRQVARHAQSLCSR
jgi:hypothetical protein